LLLLPPRQQAYKDASVLAAAADTVLSLILRWLARRTGNPVLPTAGSGTPATDAAAAGAELAAESAAAEAAAQRLNQPLDNSICRQLAPQLRAVQTALTACCEAMALAVEQKGQYSDVLGCLQELESR